MNCLKIGKSLNKIISISGYKIVKIRPVILSKKDKTINIGPYKLSATFDHELDKFLNLVPGYSQNIARLTKSVITKYPDCKIIDIGANIGDTIAILRSQKIDNTIYSIEGDSKYFNYLSNNINQFENVYIINKYISDFETSKNIHLLSSKGTQRILKGNKNTEFFTLDQIIKKENITSAKILKIDTDGYDFKIINGASDYINKVKPIIFCEYDWIFMKENNINGIDELKKLTKYGYEKIMYFDNLGRYFLSCSLNDYPIILSMNYYIAERKGKIPYFDIAIFSNEDLDVFNFLLSQELEL